MTDNPNPTGLRIYYEGGTKDRHWVAPDNLPLGEAKRQKVGRYYKSRWSAQKRLNGLNQGARADD